MSTVITILLVIAGLVALVFIVALFVKKGYSVSQEVVINRPRSQVFNYVRLLKPQDQWSKWVMMDPNLKRTFVGTDGTVGFRDAWVGNKKAGEGEQEITQVRDGERIDIEVRFVKPFTGQAFMSMTTEDLGNGRTKLKWGTKSAMKYPMNIMIVLMNLEKMLGGDMQESLNRLKGILEK